VEEEFLDCFAKASNDNAIEKGQRPTISAHTIKHI